MKAAMSFLIDAEIGDMAILGSVAMHHSVESDLMIVCGGGVSGPPVGRTRAEVIAVDIPGNENELLTA
jgi:hypothetical protein